MAVSQHGAEGAGAPKLQSSPSLLARLAEVERFAPLTPYVVRSLREGGDLAVELFEDMIDDATRYLEAVAGGGQGARRATPPPHDPAARARVMAYQATGSLLMWLTLHPEHAEPASCGKALRAYVEEVTAPMLEMFTEGLYTDRSLLRNTCCTSPTRPATGRRTDTARHFTASSRRAAEHGPAFFLHAFQRGLNNDPCRRDQRPAQVLRKGEGAGRARPDRRRGDRPVRAAAPTRSAGTSCSNGSTWIPPRRAVRTPRATGRRSRWCRCWPATSTCCCSTSRPPGSTR